MDKQETLKRIEEDKELKGKLLEAVRIGGDMEEVLNTLEATTYPSGTGTRKVLRSSSRRAHTLLFCLDSCEDQTRRER